MLPTPLHGNGARILYSRAGAYPLEKFNVMDIIRHSQMSAQILWMADDYSNINGIINVMDMSAVTSKHFLQFNPTVAKRMTVYQEEAVPLRTKATHFVNVPKGFETFFNMVKPMLSQKQQNRVGLQLERGEPAELKTFLFFRKENCLKIIKTLEYMYERL